MIEKIKALCVKYREFLVYFIVGCLTTLVAAAARFGFNFLFFGGTLHPTFAQNTALAIVDWVAGVAFAYPTNRKWVFQSKNPNILAEAGGFVASRLATLGMDWAVSPMPARSTHGARIPTVSARSRARPAPPYTRAHISHMSLTRTASCLPAPA